MTEIKKQTIGKPSYFINTTDPRINSAENARLNDQDMMLNDIMNLFPRDPKGKELYTPKSGDIVLDVACGPANWIREIARNNELTHNSPNVKFCAVDITEPFAYIDPLTSEKKLLPGDTFDFVNARFVSGILAVEQWPEFVAECYRVCAPGGLIRITEGDTGTVADAPYHHKVLEVFRQSLWMSGRAFSPCEWAVGPMIGSFMEDAGCVEVVEESYVLNYSAGKPWHDVQAQNLKMSIGFLKPFMTAQGTTEEEFHRITEGMNKELDDPKFKALWYILSVIGRKAV